MKEIEMNICSLFLLVEENYRCIYMLAIMWKIWQPKNLDEAQLPLLILAWILGYGIIEHPLNNLGLIFSLIYLTLISSVYSILFYFSYEFFTSLDWPKNEHYFFLSFVVIQCTFMGINFIKGLLSKHTLAEVYKRNIAVEKTLEFLGRSVNPQKAFRDTLVNVFFLVVFCTGSNILIIIWFRQNIPILEGTLAIFIFQHPIHVNEIVDTNFMMSIRHIRMRLEKVNEILLDFNHIKNNLWIQKTGDISFFNSSFSPRFYKRNIAGTSSISNNNDSVPSAENILQIIKCLHLEIKVLSKKIMSIFGPSLIITMITTFGMITYLFYSLYLSMWDPEIFYPDRAFRTFVVIMSIVGYLIKMITINYVCAQTAAEYRKTREIVHKLNIQSYDLNIRNNIQQFCIQLMHHPLVFSPCGLIQLGFPFIRDFAGSLTTYLIILIQINDSIPKFSG